MLLKGICIITVVMIVAILIVVLNPPKDHE
jgi:hypothetical protein